MVASVRTPSQSKGSAKVAAAIVERLRHLLLWKDMDSDPRLSETSASPKGPFNFDIRLLFLT